MNVTQKERFVDYVRRVGLHELDNWPKPKMRPADAMKAIKAEVLDMVLAGLARAGREWNARQPVNQLPSELVSLVCADLTLKQRGRASHICTNWRSAIVSDPTLWNVIDERHATGHGLPTFLERSASAPVSLTCWNFATDAMAYWVSNHLFHIQRLTMGPSTKRADIILQAPAPILERFAMRCAGYTIHSSIFGGLPTRLTHVNLALVRLPETTPVSAFLSTIALSFEPASIGEIDLEHIFRVFPSLVALTLDTTSCPGGNDHPVLPFTGDIRGLTDVVLKGRGDHVARLIPFFRTRVRRLTVNAISSVLLAMLFHYVPGSTIIPGRRLTWLHQDEDSPLDRITLYQSSEPCAEPSPSWRCFEREHLEETARNVQSIDVGQFVLSPAYTENLTSFVIHDSFWPTGRDALPRMPALQLLTVLCAARRLVPDLYFAREGAATLECPALQAVCLGAIWRGWGGRNWLTVPPGLASSFLRDIIGLGEPTPDGGVRKVQEIAFKNLTLLEDDREDVEELADRIWFEEDLEWDGLWF